MTIKVFRLISTHCEGILMRYGFFMQPENIIFNKLLNFKEKKRHLYEKVVLPPSLDFSYGCNNEIRSYLSLLS